VVLPLVQAIVDVNQDKLDKAAGYFEAPGAPAPINTQLYPYWAGQLSDGVVIGLLGNTGSKTFNFSFKDVPGLQAHSYF
jgi:alpha-galactosidase